MEHLNSLGRGLTSDSDPSMQPKDTYRYGRNGTLISRGDNMYSYESLTGNTVDFSMPEHITGGTHFVPHGWFRLGDLLIIHSTDEKSLSGGDGEIGYVTFRNDGTGEYTAVYYEAGLNYTQAKMISGYGLEENDVYHRIYWTDNFNQPRSLNMVNPILTTSISSGSLVVGDKYMVITDSIGNVVHNAVTYGPKQAAGNVFTAVNANYTPSGDVRVIKYLDVNTLDYTPKKQQGNINFSKYLTTGNLYAGVKLYAYRLTTTDGYESSWSYITDPIHVTSYLPSGGYPQYQGRGGGGSLISTNKAIELVIDELPSYFDEIEVAVIEMDEDMDVFRNIEIFWRSGYTGASITITHYGQENLLPITLDDLALSAAVIVKAKDMATLKQRQILANLTEREELNWTPSGHTVSTHLYTIPSDDEGLTTDGGGSPGAHPGRAETYLNPSSGVVSGNIQPGGHYVVSGGTNIEYPVASATFYLPGETFVGTDGNSTFTSTGGAIVKACIRIKKYTTFAGADKYQIIELEDEWFDYKSMASHRYLKGYWRDETYRIGVLAWDHFGNPYAVRWLDDVTIEGQSDASGNYALSQNYPTSATFALNIVGLTISGLDISSIKDDISGISIVRVPRDKVVLAQGLMLQNTISSIAGTECTPISNPIPQWDHNVSALGVPRTREFTWNLLGPEFDFNNPALNISLISGDLLDPVSDVSPVSSGGLILARYGLHEQCYSKYYTHNRYTGNTGEVKYINSLLVQQTVPPVWEASGLLTYKNLDALTNSAIPDPLGGSGGGTDIQDKGAVGGPRTLVVADVADFTNTITGVGTGTINVDISTNRKLLVNYKRPKNAAALYGGTSDPAKANNRYQMCNHFLPITSQVLTDIHDGVGGYVLNGIEVYGGDCFVTLYDRASSVFDSDYNSKVLNNGSWSWGLIFPVESSYNTSLREGRQMALDTMHNGANGIAFKNLSGNRFDEEFSYNMAYSSQNNQILYDHLPYLFKSVGRFPYMARYSELKFLGERIDNMRIFKINNFKNADALHGEINNVRVSYDRLFYWQNKGIGYFPINERETISSALGGAVQLGVGGVMERYDTLRKYHGNQHQFGLVSTSDGWVWFDMRRRAFLYATYNGQAVDIGLVAGLQDFFDNAFPVDTGFANIYKTDTPLLGLGIVGVFDGKETVWLTFKSTKTLVSYTGQEYPAPDDFTVLFSVPKKTFIGISDFAPGNIIEHDGYTYAVRESRDPITATAEYQVGDIVSKNGINYVCVQSFIALNPIPANQEPDFVGSTLWKVANNERDVYIQEKGDICKFFGIVFPYELEVVSNGNINEEQAYDNVEVYGNDTALTDVYYENENQTASDLNIDDKNKDFRFIDNSWWFNVALENSKARMLGHYMKVKVVVKNYLTDPTISLNKIKRIVYLKTIFRKKR